MYWPYIYKCTNVEQTKYSLWLNTETELNLQVNSLSLAGARFFLFFFLYIRNHIFIEPYVITYATEDAIDEMYVPFTFTCLHLRGGVYVITKRVGNRGNTIQNYRFT